MISCFYFWKFPACPTDRIMVQALHPLHLNVFTTSPRDSERMLSCSYLWKFPALPTDRIMLQALHPTSFQRLPHLHGGDMAGRAAHMHTLGSCCCVSQGAFSWQFRWLPNTTAGSSTTMRESCKDNVCYFSSSQLLFARGLLFGIAVGPNKEAGHRVDNFSGFSF